MKTPDSRRNLGTCLCGTALAQDGKTVIANAQRALREGFRFRELSVAGHDAMIIQPEARYS